MFKTHLPSLIWAFIILVFCGYPGSGLPHVSFNFILPLDKSIHIFLFGTLCFFLQKDIKNQPETNFLSHFPLPGAFIICCLYGILIEFMQKYVFIGRSFEGMDIVADASGAFFVAFYFRYRSKLRRNADSGMTELVFEKKNKIYGAYILRMHYAKNSVKGLWLAVLLIALVFGLPFLVGLFEVPSAIEEIAEVNSLQLLDLPDFDVVGASVEVLPKTEGVSKPEIVKAVKAEPVALEEPVVKNPKSLLSEIVHQAPKDTMPEVKDSIVAEKATTEVKKNPLKMMVTALPEYPGGREAFLAFLKKNMNYPAAAKKSGITGTVLVSFVIEADGRQSKCTIIKSLDGGCNEEALRVLHLMPPWSPGKKGGANIPFMVSLPFEFVLR